MLKFLFFGDRHNSERIPSNRIDDYHANCELKDLEIISLAKQHNVNAILHPGDFWTDSDKKLSNEFIGTIARRWMMAGIPIIGIAGNHDLIGNNVDSLPDTTTGLLDTLGIFKTLSNGEILPFTDGSITVGISGTNYHKGMDKAANLADYVVQNKPYDYHIHLVHGMLTPKSYGKLFDHTLIENIAHTAADITLCGHDHLGFGIINYKNKYFINPGAVVRNTINQKEIERTVSVVLITIDDNGISCKDIPLRSAKPGKDVLSTQKRDEAKEKTEFQDFIKDGVTKLKLGTGLSITDVLEDIYNRDSIDQSIRDDITAKITAKTKSLNQNKTIAPVGTKIVKIHIYNFQSHEDTTIDLSLKYNVIVGESHQGKSAILRAIRWVVENKPTGKGIIRTGQDEAFVELTLENGTIIKRFINKKDNGYKVYFPDGTIKEGNTKMVQDIQKIMGWNNMFIGENESIPLNFLRQGDSWYLISDKYTATDRARILGAINNTDGADATIKEVEKQNSQIAEAIKHENIEIATLASEIDDVSKRKTDLIQCKALIEKAMLIIKIKEYFNLLQNYNATNELLHNIESGFNESAIIISIQKINKLLGDISTIQRHMSTLDVETRRIERIDGMLSKLSIDLDGSIKKLNDCIKTYKSIKDYSNKYNNCVIDFNNAVNQLEQLGNVDELSTAGIKKLLDAYKNISNNVTTIKKAEKAIAIANSFIKQSQIVETFPVLQRNIQTKLERYMQIKKLQENYQFLMADVKQKSEKEKEATLNHSNAIKMKVKILEENHICPTCYSTIDEHVIEQISKQSIGEDYE